MVLKDPALHERPRYAMCVREIYREVGKDRRVEREWVEAERQRESWISLCRSFAGVKFCRKRNSLTQAVF